MANATPANIAAESELARAALEPTAKNRLQESPVLREKVFRATGWVVFGHFSSQLLRFAGNLILTRLLFPEAFGLMALVQAVMVGINLISDIGIGPNIVRHKDEADRIFLNTAWTLQIARGAALFAVALLAAKPIALIYGEPLLEPLLSIAALSALFGGFNATSLVLVERAIRPKSLVAIDLGSYIVGLAITITWAIVSPSVWSLVCGGVAAAALKMAASHIFLPGRRNRIEFDFQSASSIISFGKWVLLGSALAFFAGEGMRLIFGAVLDVRGLACLTLASTLNRAPTDIVRQVSSRVLFPAYAEIDRHRPHDLYKNLLRSRLLLIAPLWVSAVFFAFFGQRVVGLLYDARYADAGWMLHMLASGSMVGALTTSYGGVLLARGRARADASLLAIQVFVQLCGVACGFTLAEEQGAVIGFAAAWWLMYPLYAVTFARLSLWQPRLDIPILIASTAVVGLSCVYG